MPYLPGMSEKGRRASPVAVERRTLMTGDVLTDAFVSQGAATEGMVVDFVLELAKVEDTMVTPEELAKEPAA